MLLCPIVSYFGIHILKEVVRMVYRVDSSWINMGLMHPATRVWTGPTSLEKWLSLSVPLFLYVYWSWIDEINFLRWAEQIGAPKALRIKVEDLSKKYQKLQDEELSTSDQPAAGNDPELDYFMVQIETYTSPASRMQYIYTCRNHSSFCYLWSGCISDLNPTTWVQ